METIEKNDVDISSIFNWGRVFEVIGYSEERPEALVFMKLLGDKDINRARVYALRESGELRRKLKDINSDEYLAYMQDMEDLELSDMIGLIKAFSMRDITKAVRKVVDIKEPKAPKSDASLEEMEKYQKEVDEYPRKRAEAFEQATMKELEKVDKQLSELSKEEIYKRYTKLLVSELCERRALDAFKEMQVYLGCFKDSSYKEPFFESFEEFQNLQPYMKERFIEAYNSLDIEMSELKKLRLATP